MCRENINDCLCGYKSLSNAFNQKFLKEMIEYEIKNTTLKERKDSKEENHG